MELSVEIVKVSFKQISLCRLCECCLQHQSSLSAPVPPTFSSDCVPTHSVGLWYYHSVRMFCVPSLCISAAVPHSTVKVVPGEVGD